MRWNEKNIEIRKDLPYNCIDMGSYTPKYNKEKYLKNNN